ncbi:MAG: hypothetical protein AAGA60_01780 [Cyanobacteria bacterium P01_E01_bin.42]
MRISFDLDDLLICDRALTLYEREPFFLLRYSIAREPLRLGTAQLIKTLQKYDCEVWIYTTSYHSPLAIRLWLCCYGISIQGIINQTIHEKYFQNNAAPSKHPRAFGIDLHIDDSSGVKLEGEKYGFEVLVISPEDRDWGDRVLNTVLRYINAKK